MGVTFSMDLTAISAFVAVGDRKGFRAAAAALGMTSAGISKAVSRLEAELGVTLVARTTRSVRLTAAGLGFHARCKAILADLDQAGREAADAATLPQGRLVISASRTFGRSYVLPVVADYVKRFPQAEAELRLSDQLADMVMDDVDLAVRIGHLPDSGLVVTRVSQTRHVLCGSPEYLAAAGTPAHPDDLHRHVVVGHVAPETALRFTYSFMVDGAATRVSLPSRLTVDDGEALAEAGARSAGLVMANDYLLARHVADGSLVRVLRAFEMPPVPISIVHSPGRPSSAARTFTTMLRRHLAAAPSLA